MNFLTKEQILEAQDRQFKEVDVPEWGGKVRLVSFDADQALLHGELMKRRQAGEGGPNPLSAMLAQSIVDANGNRIFDEKDIPALGRKAPAALMRLVSAVQELNKLDEVETGNSVASPNVA